MTQTWYYRSWKTQKRTSTKIRTSREYHVKNNKYVKHEDSECIVPIVFNRSKICRGTQKPHGVCGLSKHYYISFDPKPGHVTYTICCIPCDCTLWTYRLYQPWVPVISPQKQLSYKTLKDCTYWPVLGSFNSWNILQLSHKATSSE